MSPRYLAVILFLGMICISCRNTTVYTGPVAKVGPLEVAVAIDSNGDVTLSGGVSQTLVGIDPLGLGWTVGFETTLYEANKEKNTLFILWEDESGTIWQKQYRIGQPFTVRFTHEEWVREIRQGENGNIIVAVEPRGTIPGYEDLREDIQNLVERWDTIHNQADRYWDTSNLDTVLRGDALRQQQSTVERLEDNHCYWIIRELAVPGITRFDVVGSDFLIVEVYKEWDMDLYCHGTKSGDDDGPFTMRYDIERISGHWYITRKQVVSSH